MILVGAAFFALYVFSWLYGTTPEGELTLVEGVPHDISLTVVRGRYGHITNILKFRVGGMLTEYSSDMPRYEEVSAVVQSGELVQAWVSTKRETVFARQGWVPLYKLESRGRVILDYETTAQHNKTEANSLPICSAVVTAIGAFGLLAYLRQRRKYNRWVRLSGEVT